MKMQEPEFMYFLSTHRQCHLKSMRRANVIISVGKTPPDRFSPVIKGKQRISIFRLELLAVPESAACIGPTVLPREKRTPRCVRPRMLAHPSGSALPNLPSESFAFCGAFPDNRKIAFGGDRLAVRGFSHRSVPHWGRCSPRLHEARWQGTSRRHSATAFADGVVLRIHPHRRAHGPGRNTTLGPCVSPARRLRSPTVRKSSGPVVGVTVPRPR